MKIAVLDPISGIAGDMFLGALLDLGLEEEFITGLPAALGLEGVTVHIRPAIRATILCKKVDFDIPPQPHGRHLSQIKEIVEASSAPAWVKSKAIEAFTLITEAEAAVHGTTVEKVHLHEVGSVDAILDIVGSIWGLQKLGYGGFYVGQVPVGDGFVDTAHGSMAVPTPATLRLLEGQRVRPGPVGSGELVTPTGAALIRVLKLGDVPETYTILTSGYGAGTKDFPGRANATRIVVCETDQSEIEATDEIPVSDNDWLVLLTTDIDDSTGEDLAAVADDLRKAGALDVILLQTIMKKGRPGVRMEVLCDSDAAEAIEDELLIRSSAIGVRRSLVERRALERNVIEIQVADDVIQLKVVVLPDGTVRSKPEADDITRVAEKLKITRSQLIDRVTEALKVHARKS